MSVGQHKTLSRQLVPKEISKIAVHAILEDSYGFIWYGGNGLFKYDGYTSKAYQPVSDDSISVTLGTVYALLEDRKGRIWIGSTNGLFRYDRKTDQIQRYFSDKLTNRFGKTSIIMSLYEDTTARLWVGGKDKLFVIPDPDGEEVQASKILDLSLSNSYRGVGIRSVREDNKGRIFAFSTNGLWQFENDFTFTHQLPVEFVESPVGFRIYDAEWGKGDTLWLATIEGLWIFETESTRFSKVAIPENTDKLVRTLLVDEQNQVWIATKNEIFIRHIDGNFNRIVEDSHYLLDGIKVLFRDRFENLWLGGTLGIGMLNFNQDKKLPFYQVEHDSPYQDNYFYRIMQDSSGGFWFRMIRTGLGYSPALDAEFEILLQPKDFYINGGEIKGICSDTDANVWVITLTNGLYLFENGQKEFRHIDLGDSLRRIAIPMAIITDRENDRLLWFSSKVGLCSVDRFTYKRKWYHPKNDLPWLDMDDVGMIGQANDGNIWCSLKAKGKSIVGYFDKKNSRFIAEQELLGRLYPSRINQFKRVSKDKMWVATNKGLVVIDTRQKTQRFWTKKNGFPTSYPMSITPDKHGNIWFTSIDKIYKYDGQKFEKYNANDKIREFVNTSSALTKEGLVVFGGANGLHVFDPQKLEKDSIGPKLYLTDFRVFNIERKLGPAYESVKEITLPYKDNIFTFEFSGLHFAHSESIEYWHKLDGFEKNWVKSNSNERRATYTNLSPDTYNFKVFAVNADGFWTTEEEGLNIKITILPPWFRTTWAYILWAVTLLGGLYYFYKYQLNHRLAEAEAHRLKELDHAKSQLYTNITHEFRTPLTIILGMTDQVKSDPKKWFNEGLRLIRRNGKQLLNLVNQLLDLSKLESNNMPLKMINGDIVSLTKYQIESFHSYADSKDIRLHFSSDFQELYMDYDPEKLQNIVSNLLSNAVKFTPSGGDVYFDLRYAKGDENTLLIQIRDNGVGIKSEHLSHIFDRFYQVDASTTRRGEGTGIGLALTKELVKILNGKIDVESNIGTGTKFTILIPITQTAEEPATKRAETLQIPIVETILLKNDNTDASVQSAHKDESLVLLIEDNEDVITYLASFLSGEYQIETALDGQEGIEKAIDLTPDLIVSDVMMPRKDGFEVCATLKQDERTSHIPIILLTAKSDQVAKLEGLSHGADAYLSKPFNKTELLVRIEKLIELRKNLQAHYHETEDLLKISEKQEVNSEDVFLQKVIQIVNENLSDENFGLPKLCSKAGLSRSQLFRKLKALTGKSTTNFIRSIRLAKGKELLLTTDLNISEVAYQVGFGSAIYFTKSFSEEFDFPPSEMREK